MIDLPDILSDRRAACAKAGGVEAWANRNRLYSLVVQQVLDALPAQVRRALHEATGPFSPSEASSACQEFGPDAMVKMIWSASQSECRAWNDAYLAQHGRDTPAYAARATIQPYGRRA